jgi:hypothetical protein
MRGRSRLGPARKLARGPFTYRVFPAYAGLCSVMPEVFKTGAAWQPYARSVRLRRRSVESKTAQLDIKLSSMADDRAQFGRGRREREARRPSPGGTSALPAAPCSLS